LEATQDPFAAGTDAPQDDPFAEAGIEDAPVDPADEVEGIPVVDREGQPVADPDPGPAPEQPPGFPGGGTPAAAPLPATDPVSPAAPSTDAPEPGTVETPAAPTAAPQQPGEEPTAPPAPDSEPATPSEPPAAPQQPAQQPQQAQGEQPTSGPGSRGGKPTIRHYKLFYATGPKQWQEHPLTFKDEKTPPGVKITQTQDGERWMECRNNDHAIKVAYAILGSPADGVTVWPVPHGAYKPKRVKPKPPAPEKTRLDIS
jgi:hypothetical protein